MNAILLVATMAMGQCGMGGSYGGTYYSTPSYYSYPSYSVVQCEPVLHYDIRYNGRVYSKFYAPVKLPNGNTIQVPVINGMLPRVRTVYSGGYEHRICTYDTNSYYKGGVPTYVYSNSATQTRTGTNNIQPPPTPVRETLPEDIRREPEPVKSVEKEAVIKEPPKMQALPRKDTNQSTELDDSRRMVPVTPPTPAPQKAPTPVKETTPLSPVPDPMSDFDPMKLPYEFKATDEADFTKQFPKYSE